MSQRGAQHRVRLQGGDNILPDEPEAVSNQATPPRTVDSLSGSALLGVLGGASCSCTDTYRRYSRRTSILAGCRLRMADCS